MQKTSLFGVEYAEHVTVCQRWRRCFIPAAAAPCSQHIADGLPRHARNPWVRGLPACRSDGEIEHAAHFPAPRPKLPLRSSLIARRNSQKARTIRAPSLRRVDAGRRTLRVAWAVSLGQSSEEPALHCGVVRLPPSGPRRGDICSLNQL